MQTPWVPHPPQQLNGGYFLQYPSPSHVTPLLPTPPAGDRTHNSFDSTRSSVPPAATFPSHQSPFANTQTTPPDDQWGLNVADYSQLQQTDGGLHGTYGYPHVNSPFIPNGAQANHTFASHVPAPVGGGASLATQFDHAFQAQTQREPNQTQVNNWMMNGGVMNVVSQSMTVAQTLCKFEGGREILREIDEWVGAGKKEGNCNMASHQLSQTVDCSFIERAYDVRHAVVMIEYTKWCSKDKCDKRYTGTGNIFGSSLEKNEMPAKFLLLTCHHCLPSAAVADTCFFSLDYHCALSEPDPPRLSDIDYDGQMRKYRKQDNVFSLAPGTFFASDEDLDYTLCSIDLTLGQAKLLSHRFSFHLSNIAKRVEKFSPVNIASHPRGRPLAFSIRGANYLMEKGENNETVLISKLGEVVKHSAYTLGGSSGALLCNDQWELIALHTEGTPFYNEYGMPMKRTADGAISVFDENTDNHDDQLYVSNRGTNIQSIVDHLKIDYKDYLEEEEFI